MTNHLWFRFRLVLENRLALDKPGKPKPPVRERLQPEDRMQSCKRGRDRIDMRYTQQRQTGQNDEPTDPIDPIALDLLPCGRLMRVRLAKQHQCEIRHHE